MFSPTEEFLWSVKLKQLELQFNLQDRRAHSVASKLRARVIFLRHMTRVRILTQYIHDIPASLHKAGQI